MASKGMRSTLQATKERLPSLAKGGGAVSVRAREHSDDGLPGNNPGLSKSAAITKLKRELAVSQKKMCCVFRNKYIFAGPER